MLLMLPITVVDIEPLSFVDALFMSASAVCVSGVSIFSLGDNFSVFGQIIIIILVQIGALGIMTITTILAVVMGKRIQLRDRLLIQESLQRWSVAGVVRLVISIVKMTVAFEFTYSSINSSKFSRVINGGISLLLFNRVNNSFAAHIE